MGSLHYYNTLSYPPPFLGQGLRVGVIITWQSWRGAEQSYRCNHVVAV